MKINNTGLKYEQAPIHLFISVLRGINVSGQRKILMSDLKALYENIGFKEVKSYIQSGNIVFQSIGKSSGNELERKIEKVIFEKYHFDVPVIVRSCQEMKRIIQENTFLKQKNIDAKKLHVTFLSKIPFEEDVESLKAFDFSPDKFIVAGKEVYLYVPNIR